MPSSASRAILLIGGREGLRGCVGAAATNPNRYAESAERLHVQERRWDGSGCGVGAWGHERRREGELDCLLKTLAEARNNALSISEESAE